jgi:hypothetical protein
LASASRYLQHWQCASLPRRLLPWWWCPAKQPWVGWTGTGIKEQGKVCEGYVKPSSHSQCNPIRAKCYYKVV